MQSLRAEIYNDSTYRLNDIDPQAWLADVLDRIADHPASRLYELLPWNSGRQREAPRGSLRPAPEKGDCEFTLLPAR